MRNFILLAAVLLVSLSGCSKADDGDAGLTGTVWESKDGVKLTFNTDELCRLDIPIMSHRTDFSYKRGYGIDLFFYEQTAEGDPRCLYVGKYTDSRTLRLYGVDGQSADEVIATLKRQR